MTGQFLVRIISSPNFCSLFIIILIESLYTKNRQPAVVKMLALCSQTFLCYSQISLSLSFQFYFPIAIQYSS